MSYGQNAPNGFQPVKNIPQSVYNGQYSGDYVIQSGYPYNIFRGDPVTLGKYTFDGTNWAYQTDGYIHSLAEALVVHTGTTGDPLAIPGPADAASVATNIPVLGTFWGASFITDSALNPIDPASPGRMFWPGGTATSNGQDAQCMILEDPMTVYTVQTNGGRVNGIGAGADDIGLCYGANFQYILNAAGTLPVAPFVKGNTKTGLSSAFLELHSNGTNARGGWRMKRIDPANPPYQMSVNGLPATGILYNNVYVVCAKTVWSEASNAVGV